MSLGMEEFQTWFWLGLAPALHGAGIFTYKSGWFQGLMYAYMECLGFQVPDLHARIAVIWEDLEASYPLRMGGGTKWAAQVYVDRFQPIGVEAAESCHLYLYEVNSAVWKRWDCLAQAWTPASPPILSRTMSFAGIGTRTPPQHAIDAIHSLFKDLSGHLSDSAPDPHLDEPKESNCSGESHGPSALHVPSALCASGRRWRRRD